MAADVPAPSPSDSREEIAYREVGRTKISAGAARLMSVAFAALLAGVPAAHVARELAAGRAAGPPENALSWTQIGPVVMDAISMWEAAAGGALDRLIEANHVLRVGLKRYETDLEDASWLRAVVQPWMQWATARWLRGGSENVQMGRNGWLFFGPELEYISSAGFLDPREHARRRREGDRWTPAPQPDPLAAIFRFRDELSARGIHLVLLPVPVKHGVHPERFSARAAGGTVLRNRDWPAFVRALDQAGVEWVDPAPALLAAAAAHGAAYLRTDTHWRPEAMEAVAALVADRLAARLPSTKDPGWMAGRETVTNLGDLAVMLNTGEAARWPAPEVAEIRPVRSADGRPWTPDRAADVLVLGDSFCNVFALDSMGWGRSAGFAEHLSLRLGRPVDRMVRNDAGAFATRSMLVNEAARNPARLAGKRVVVWQFSERELLRGDWKLLDWPAPSGREGERP